jgi:MATE family multidrug resistance protein
VISQAPVSQELRSTLRLALPVIAAEVGWISMSLVDTLMVGPLGPAAIGAVGTGSILYMAVMMVGFGTLFALDTFVSQSYGAGRIDLCHRWLFAGVHLAVVLSVILAVLALGLIAALPAFGVHPDVLAHLRPYLSHLLWSTPPLLAYAVFRRYLQAMHIVRPVMYGLLVANLVNLAANWVLIYGRLGAPALGVVGAAYATVFSRLAVAMFLFLVIRYRERDQPSGLHDVPFRPDLTRMWAIVRLGLPAAGQLLLEVGVFAAVSAMAARIAPAAAAAHQIVLNIIGLVFMVPYGFGTAAAVRVGHAVGRGDARAARAAGWMAIVLAIASMVGSAALFAAVPEWLVRRFTSDADVIAIGIGLLFVAVVFQLFDGIQAAATGALRGLGNTQTPMLVNLVGHWVIGLPTAYLLCFRYGWGASGLWAGLAAGLIVTGGTLLAVWNTQSRRETRPLAP